MDPRVFRTPWPPDFPDVIVHAALADRDAHPEYRAAKAGNADAALVLAIDLMRDSSIQQLRSLHHIDNAVLLPVVAEEAMGYNAIPDAMAQVLARELGLETAAGEIVQTNMVGHTKAPAYQRIVTPATFEGEVRKDAHHILVDDHVGLGGTLANLRGYLEAHDAKVIAITTLTESREARKISLRAETLDMLRHRYGEALDQLWKAEFGYGLDCLTEIEGQILCRRHSIAEIEDFLAKAAVEARGRGLEPTAGEGR